MSFENYSCSPEHIVVVGLIILIWIIAGVLICNDGGDKND